MVVEVSVGEIVVKSPYEVVTPFVLSIYLSIYLSLSLSLYIYIYIYTLYIYIYTHNV